MAKPKDPENLNYSVPDGTPVSRLDIFLVNCTQLSRALIQEQIQDGNVRVNEKVTKKPSHKIHPGDKITGKFKPDTSLDLEPIEGKLDILFEDEHLIFINKAQGVVVHPAKGHREATLVHHLLYHLRSSPKFKETSDSRPGIVHRLDRGTSGILVVAKDRQVHELLSKAFKSRKVKKEYEAIVWGKPPEKGRFESSIGRDMRDRKKMSSRTREGRLAITDFQTLTATQHMSHVALFPYTGRTHQLRVHLSENKFPVVGDAMYGPSAPPHFDELSPILQRALEGLSDTLLHARRLTLAHPVTGAALCLEAARPAVFEKFLMLLRNFDTRIDKL